MSTLRSRMRSAILGVLVPLARMMLSLGMNARDATELVRIAFVKAAQIEYGSKDKPANISQIARHTRLSRQVVSGMVNDPSGKLDTDRLTWISDSKVLALWHSVEAYLDEQGKPKPLSVGPGPGTFAELVSLAAPGESHLHILELLIRNNCIEWDEKQRLRALRRDFIIANDLPRIIAVGLTPLAETMVHNWNSPFSSGLCQRVAHSKTIDPSKYGYFRRIARARITRFLEEFDDVLSQSDVEDEEGVTDTATEESARIGIGAYYFEEPRKG